MAKRDDLTSALINSHTGDARAADRLLEAVYTELRSLAEARLARERSDHTLLPTALVHEVYLKLVDQDRVDWQGRTHFRAVAVEAMRRILIDHARKKKSEKRGGEWRKVTLDCALSSETGDPLDALAVHEALDAMRRLDERQARVVELRILGGLSAEDTAQILGVSSRTVERDWVVGRAWLLREMDGRGT